MRPVAEVGKAITAAVVAFLTALTVALDDATISTQEWLVAAVALVTALGAVWAVPNKTPDHHG